MNLNDHLEQRQAARNLFSNSAEWLSASFVADYIGTSERKLRGEDSPIRPYVISGDEGYKSIFHASDREFSSYCNRIRSHAIEELKRVQYLKKKRVSEKQLCMEGVCV